MQLSSRSEWALRFTRPRIRWLALMAARFAAMLGTMLAILYSWSSHTPWAISAFLVVVLVILFAEALACERRREGGSPRAPEDAELPVRRRRETDL